MKIPRPLRGLLGSDRADDEASPRSRTPAEPLPDEAPDPEPHIDPSVRVILDSGAFDLEWFEAQTGCRFPDVQAGVEAYLAQGLPRRFSPHPLFEPQLTDPEWSRRQNDPLLHFLATGDFRAHPLFQDAELEDPAAGHQGRRWLRWVQDARPDTPVPGQPHTWGLVRQAMLLAAADWRREDELGIGTRWVRRVALLPDPRDLDDLTPADTAEGTGSGGDGVGVAAEAPRLVSVVLPAGGGAGGLGASIESALTQHHRNLELIVVVDPRSGDLLAEADRAAARDPRVRVVQHREADVAAARARGLRDATGDYVAFLDAGCTWETFHLHHVVARLHANGWAMAHGVVKDAATSRYRAFAGSYPHLLRGSYIDLAALVVARDLVERAGGLPVDADDPDAETVLGLARLEQPHLVRVLSLVRPSAERSRGDDLREQGVLARHLLDHYDSGSTAPGRVSLVVPARHFSRSVTPIAAMADDDLEVVIIGNHTRVHRCFTAGALAGWPVRVVSYPHTDNWALLASLGVASATGEKVVVVRQGAQFTREVVDHLTAALDEPGVAISQALCRHPDDTVASLGAGFPEQVSRRRIVTPFPLFDGYAAGIVPPPSPTPIPAVWSDVIAARRDDVVAVGGLAGDLGNDFADTDLSLALAEAGRGSSVCLRDVRLIVTPDERFGFTPAPALAARRFQQRHATVPAGTREILLGAGLAIDGWTAERLPGTSDAERTEWSMRPRLAHGTRVRVAEGLPALWWTLDTAATAGPLGDQWGDTHFAESLAAALRRLGQTVSVDRRQARGRATRTDDDVTLVLRGLNRVEPSPNQLTAIWVISHPEEVTPTELADYDLAFAAGVPWAAHRSAEWGIPIRPLLQCTDPELFNPGRAQPDTGPEALWVGNSRGVERPLLRMALSSGVKVSIHGSGWQPFVDDSLVISEFVPNDLLGSLYAGARVVLNDHWEDMQRDGFLSNRLFDAVACGTRVLSDEVEGIEELFAGSVRTVASQADVDRILGGPLDKWFDDRESRLATAARVAAEHSFDARARQLVEAVAAERGRVAGRPSSVPAP